MRRPVNPLDGEPPTGEPCAGDPHALFGGRGDRDNRFSLPLSHSLSYGPPDSSGGPERAYNMLLSYIERPATLTEYATLPY